MGHTNNDRRLVELTPEQRQAVSEAVDRVGLVAAAKELGLGRTTVLSILARGRVLPGTGALLREALMRRGGIVA